MTTEIQFEELNINPDRICEGISKIGYSPSSALMDIIDNSVTAEAKKIYIDFQLREGVPLTRRDSILSFRVIDNGFGMENFEIKKALDLGSLVDYPNNSLSKFGLGLKSAGFSLGNRIQVVSKKNNTISNRYYVDRETIRDRNTYGVCIESAEQAHIEILEKHSAGTIIEVTSPISPQDSAAKILKELREKLGIVYYHFLSREENPLSIELRYRDRREEVEPIDIMFWQQALESFDPDTYNGKLPCKVLDEEIEHPYDTEIEKFEKFRLQVTIFPSDKMKNFAGFSEEERSQIAEFKIGRDNAGFFIFRNGRLIRWADRIAGVNRNDIGFRAKVLISTEHDDLFHVDVSKQNLMIPEEVEATLRRMCRLPLSDSRDLFKICKNIQDVNEGNEGNEGTAFDNRNQDFEEIDSDEDISPPPPHEQAKRREHISERSQQDTTPGMNDNEGTNEFEDENVFRRIRYTDRMMGLNFWKPGYDKDFGTFVRINRYHAFYQLVLNSLPPADSTRQAVEAILFAFAIAENKTIQNLSDVEESEIINVLERFKRVSSQNLDAWANVNQDLYD